MEPPSPASAHGDSWMRDEGWRVWNWVRVVTRGEGIQAPSRSHCSHSFVSSSQSLGQRRSPDRLSLCRCQPCQSISRTPCMKTRTQDRSQTKHKMALKLTSAGIQIHWVSPFDSASQRRNWTTSGQSPVVPDLPWNWTINFSIPLQWKLTISYYIFAWILGY